jgi:hypothetical protein
MLVDALYSGKEVLERLLTLDIRKADLLHSSIYRFPLHQLVVNVTVLANVLQSLILLRQLDCTGKRGGFQALLKRSEDVV